MDRTSCWTALLATLVLTACACAQPIVVQVTNWTSPSPCDGSVATYRINAGQAFQIPVPACTRRINVYTDPLNLTLTVGRLTISQGTINPVDVYFGQGALNDGIDPVPAVCGDWAGLDTSALSAADRGRFRLAGAIAGNLTDTIHVGQIFRFDFGGSVNAAIHAANPGNLSTCMLFAAAIGASGSMTLDSGRLLRVVTGSGGNVLRPIEATNGRIDDVIVGGSLLADVRAPQEAITGQVQVAGDIGSSGAPRAIVAKTGIGGVQAQNIYATITANANGGIGNLKLLRTTNGGHFTGQVFASSLADGTQPFPGATDRGVFIAGHLAGTLRFVRDAASPTTTGNVLQDIVVGQSSPGGSLIADSAIISTVNVHFNDGPNADAGTIGAVEIGIAPGGSGCNGNISLGTFLDHFDIGPTGLAGNIIMSSPLPAAKTLRIRGPLVSGFTGGGAPISACIDILPTAGLHGQVLVNTDQVVTSNQGADAWQTPASPGPALVRVGTGVNRIVLNSPAYATPSPDLGGGAVGVVRYGFYHNDCDPPGGDLASLPATRLLNSTMDFADIFLRWRGPITPGGADVPLAIHYDAGAGSWIPATPTFAITVNPSGSASARSVRLTRAPGAAPILGLYRVTPVTSGLKCVGVTSGTAPDVADFAYYFRFLPDCDNNDIWDYEDIQSNPKADCDHNGVLDVCEIRDAPYLDSDDNDILDICQSPYPCSADFDGSGDVDPADVAAFVNAWYADLTAGTVTLGDFDEDGVITPSDVAAFIQIWFRDVSNGC